MELCISLHRPDEESRGFENCLSKVMEVEGNEQAGTRGGSQAIYVPTHMPNILVGKQANQFKQQLIIWYTD
jgi:hypothetical protein